MAQLNKTPFTIQVRRGLRSALLATTSYFFEGELAFTTDTKQLFVGDSNYRAVPVQTLDMAVVDRTSAQVCVDRAAGTLVYKF